VRGNLEPGIQVERDGKEMARKEVDSGCQAGTINTDSAKETLASALKAKKMKALREYQRYATRCDRHIQALEDSDAEAILKAASQFYLDTDVDV
jgi:acetylglutamate kinase